MPVSPIFSILAVDHIIRLLPRILRLVKSNSNLFDNSGGDIRLRATYAGEQGIRPKPTHED